MKSKAFIVAKNEVVAIVDTDLKSGTMVLFSYAKVPEKINASREWNLLNCFSGKILRAKKWERKCRFEHPDFGKEINSGEFFLSYPENYPRRTHGY